MIVDIYCIIDELYLRLYSPDGRYYVCGCMCECGYVCGWGYKDIA